MVSGPLCVSLEQKRKKSADIGKCRKVRNLKGASAVSPELHFLRISIIEYFLEYFYSNDISVHVFKGIADCNHRFDASKGKSSASIKNEENKNSFNASIEI